MLIYEGGSGDEEDDDYGDNRFRFQRRARKNVDERENPRVRWLNLARTLGPTLNPLSNNMLDFIVLF